MMLLDDDLISPEYRAQAEELHRLSPRWGNSGGKCRQEVMNLRVQYNAESVLDYGCGKGTLAMSLPFAIREYDPAIPEKAALAAPADLVVCTDVLEHVEPERLEFVLADLWRVMLVAGYLTIHTGPAHFVLPDGRNAHLIQEGREWWLGKLSKYFLIERMTERRPVLTIVVRRGMSHAV